MKTKQGKTKTFGGIPTTREAKTEGEYRKRSLGILSRYREAMIGAGHLKSTTGSGYQWLDGKLIGWLEAYRNEVSPSSWRQYRASLSFTVNEMGFVELSEKISEISTEGCAVATKTSARKKKSVTDEEIVELTKYLLAPPASEASFGALNFFLANLIVGLRPSEWYSSKLFVDGKIFDLQKLLEIPHRELSSIKVESLRLIVHNAKTTNGRAHGPTRTINLSELSPQDKMVLFAHWRCVAQIRTEEEYAKFQGSCKDKIGYATKKLWPKKKRRPTLYSTRHQSVADGKKSGLPLKDLAALYGHATDRTASEHYGRRQFGKSGSFRMAAEPEEVEKVREVPKTWSPPSRDLGITKK